MGNLIFSANDSKVDASITAADAVPSDNVPNAMHSRRDDAFRFRGGPLKATDGHLMFGTWNVEGLTETKVVELQLAMAELGVGLLSLQETHRSQSEYLITEEGFLLILSGSANDDREHAGVGFLVSPRLRKHVIGFRQATSRMASIKLRVVGGKVPIIRTTRRETDR